MRIVILDGYAANPGDISWEGFREFGELTVYDRTSPEDIVKRAYGHEIVITNKCTITREIMQQLPGLKYIGVLATGYNIIDTAAAAEMGIAVTNVPAYSTMSVAQHVISFILAIANRVDEHARAVGERQWCSCSDFCFWNNSLTELDGKTLGIIGYGSIGRQVGKIAEAMGMKILAYSPSIADKSMLDRIYTESDIITLHCPQKADNAGMINEQTIAKMKKSVWLINTARGGLIDENAVAQALKNGDIAYYCADVVSSEPMKQDNPLLTAPNCIITPHIAWAPVETRERLAGVAVSNLKAFLNGESINRVDKN